MVESLFKRLERVTLQWDEEVNKIFLKQLEEVSRSRPWFLYKTLTSLVFTGWATIQEACGKFWELLLTYLLGGQSGVLLS